MNVITCHDSPLSQRWAMMYDLMCNTYADDIRPIDTTDSWNQGSQGLEPLDNDVKIEISGGAVRGIRLAQGGLHQQPEKQRQAQQRSPGCRLTVPPLGWEGSGRSALGTMYYYD